MNNHIEKCKNKLKKQYLNRDSNIEILRIISMIMIIMHHYALYSGFEFKTSITINKIIVEIIKSLGTLGVSIFIIISGYFYDKTIFKLKKLVNLILKIWIYSSIGLIIGIAISSNKLTMINIIKSIMPTTFGLYWFASCYILLYAFSPWIKKIIDKLEKEELKSCLVLMIFIWSILAIIPKTKVFYSEYMSFVLIYIIGAYIRKYGIDFFNDNRKRKKILIIVFLTLILFVVILTFLSGKITFLGTRIQYFNQLKSPLILLLSILMLNVFNKLQNNRNLLVNLIAGTTFGIYLMHENIFVRDIIWINIIKGNKYINSPLLIFNAIVGLIGIFLICSMIDLVIQNLIQPRVTKVFNKVFCKLLNTKLFNNTKVKIKKIYNKI